VWRFIRVVRRRRYDIVDGWLFDGYTIAALTRPWSRVPVVVAGRRSLSRYKRRSHGPLRRLADRLARRWTDAIVANSEAVARDVVAVEGVEPDRVLVIRNGVEPAVPLGPDERAARRAAWRVGPEAPPVVLGCIGAFRDVKGHDVLLDAVAALPAAGRDGWRLVLIGDGERHAAIERRIAELGLGGSVVLAGQLDDARTVIGALDVVVQASREEGLPNALLEGAAAGVAIVATAAGGTDEIVLDDVTGLLVPVDAPTALAAALARVIDDPALRTRLGEAAARHVAEAFAMDRMVDAFAALYGDLVAEAGSR
jgi:glycosyltransferase involved in cell wall biosynthesis